MDLLVDSIEEDEEWTTAQNQGHVHVVWPTSWTVLGYISVKRP
jgi:hypothetical protein